MHPACRNYDCVKGRFDFPRLERYCDSRIAEWVCPVCQHKFDKELRDVTDERKKSECENKSTAKLSPVLRCFGRYFASQGKGCTEISEMLDVHPSTAWRLIKGVSWKND